MSSTGCWWLDSAHPARHCVAQSFSFSGCSWALNYLHLCYVCVWIKHSKHCCQKDIAIWTIFMMQKTGDLHPSLTSQLIQKVNVHHGIIALIYTGKPKIWELLIMLNNSLSYTLPYTCIVCFTVSQKIVSYCWLMIVYGCRKNGIIIFFHWEQIDNIFQSLRCCNQQEVRLESFCCTPEGALYCRDSRTNCSDIPDPLPPCLHHWLHRFSRLPDHTNINWWIGSPYSK